MTKKEAILVSAYTGFLLTKNFSDVHEFYEELLGRPVFTHELIRDDVMREIRAKCAPLIIELVEGEMDEEPSEGEWVASVIPQEKYVCSVCGGACWYYDYKGTVAKSRYCPNCGSKMKGGAG